MADALEKEVRFAVVMYGGVSLAIYINGVTQELMNMVRASARSRDSGGSEYHIAQTSLSGVEAVYREVGRQLKARFVVDILSGTSAGGINAVYLAKALANDQRIDQLTDLWIEQGDIDKLINDKQSFEQLQGLVPAARPASLLNSQRMYYHLLRALQGMKPKNKDGVASQGTAPAQASPYVDELDLYITATDLQGPPLFIPGSKDQMVRERRFRNVFHFLYSTPQAAGLEGPADQGKIRNDFEEKNDPFLAFAARCTSSFPFAFEPMRLKDIEVLVGRHPFKEYSYQMSDWAPFYKDYDAPSFPEQYFADGGYLDNKPFSYATATLNRRRADLPVDRKLVYIEPAPEHIQEIRPGKVEPPDPFANVLLALTLPRYETIREDLQAITDRNKVIQAVNDIVQNVNEIYTRHRELLDWHTSQAQQQRPPWRDQFLNEMIDLYGVGYLPYHQLRVREVLTHLRELLLRRMGWKEDSHQATHLESLFRAWQQAYYKTSQAEPDEPGTKRRSENDLLFRLDTGWYFRRLHYLRGLIDALVDDLLNNKLYAPGSRSKNILDHSQAIWQVTPDNAEDYRLALLWLKEELNWAYVELRGRGRGLRSRSPNQAGNEFANAIVELKTFWESKRNPQDDAPTQLEELVQLAAKQSAHMDLNSDERQYLREGLQRLEDLTANLTTPEEGPIYRMLDQTSEKIHHALKMPPEERSEKPLAPEVRRAIQSVQNCLEFYDSRFEYFDMLTFPITYGTNVGESDVVEIIRISPEDAQEILKKEESHRKLAGTKLGNFGAFFNPQWRENDMLWGRLDGAECLIKAVWPLEMDTSERDRLIAQAHQAILEEFLLPRDNLELFQARFGLGAAEAEKLHQAVTRLSEDKTRLIENFRHTYRVDPGFPPEPTLKVVSRASSVLGQLMGGLADKYPPLSRPASLFSRFGQIFFTLISVAMPSSLANALFHTLIGSIYVIELLFVFGGRVLIGLDTPNRGIDFTTLGTEIARLGAQAFLVTLLAHLLIVILGRVITHNWNVSQFMRTGRTVLAVVFVLGAFLLMFAGLLYLGAFPALEQSLSVLRDILK